jgi:hypothetical protein
VPFSQATMTADPRVARAGRELAVSWASSDPPGTTFQLYVNGALAWWGAARSLRLPRPRGPIRLDVGTVLPSEAGTDFSALLPAAPADRVTLAWQGGPWLGADLAAFRVYGSATPGGPVSFAAPLGTVPAAVAGVAPGSFGTAGFGSGGFGAGAGSYSWTSPRLAAGTWSFAIATVDAAGNEDPSPPTVSATVAPAPRPPAPDASGRRLTYAFTPGARGGFGAPGFGAGGFGSGLANLGFGSGGFGAGGFNVGDGAGNPSVTLNWLASPG